MGTFAPLMKRPSGAKSTDKTALPSLFARPEPAARAVRRAAFAGVIRRACECGAPHAASAPCRECEESQPIRRAADGPQPAGGVPGSVREVLAAPGKPLDRATLAYFGPRFGRDFSGVRVHTGDRAAESARAVGALAYTVGPHVVFGAGRYRPETQGGRALLAHELAHVSQMPTSPVDARGALELGSPGDASERAAERAADAALNDQAVPDTLRIPTRLQRTCAVGASCLPPAPPAGGGSATGFGLSVEAEEAPKRARRAAMSPARQRATGHGLPARQLEIFLNAVDPGLLASIHGIFVDQDMSTRVGMRTYPDCTGFVPPIVGAAKPCVTVHGYDNQQALRYNSGDPVIAGQPREAWRVQMHQLLRHEIQHVQFDTAAGRPEPAGLGAGCGRAVVAFELSELNAILSEFVIAYRAIPPGAGPGNAPYDYLHSSWFPYKIRDAGESICGVLTAMRAKPGCSCTDVEKHVTDTFHFVTAAWTPAERTALRTELLKPAWHLFWPAAP